MIVDQHSAVQRVVPGMAGKMDFADGVGRQRCDIGVRIDSDIVRRNVDVVDVEQEAAAGALDDLV